MQEMNVQLGKFVTRLVLTTIIGGLWMSTAAEAKLSAPANRFYLVMLVGFSDEAPVGATCIKFTKNKFWPLDGDIDQKGTWKRTEKDGKKTAFEAELMFTDQGVPITLTLHGRTEAGGPGSTLGASGLAVVEALAVKVNVSMAGQEFKKKAACVKEAKRINEDLGLD